MKFLIRLTALVAFCSVSPMQAADSQKSSEPAAKLLSKIYDWQTLPVTPTANGVRRD